MKPSFPDLASDLLTQNRTARHGLLNSCAHVTRISFRAEEGYGWIEPAERGEERETRAIQQFWEKPSPVDAQALFRRGALWNTFVFVAQAATVWEMTRQVAPDLYQDFMGIRRALSKPHAIAIIENIYRTVRAVNFSADVCERLVSRISRRTRCTRYGYGSIGSAGRGPAA